MHVLVNEIQELKLIFTCPIKGQNGDYDCTELYEIGAVHILIM